MKQLWVYIREHSLQDPGDKRKIICDDALRNLLGTNSTDMFKMNKLLSKHIWPLNNGSTGAGKLQRVVVSPSCCGSFSKVRFEVYSFIFWINLELFP